MSRSGPPPLPTAVKLVRGNPGKRPLPADEPTPEPGATPPTWMTKAARKYWPDIADQLMAANVLGNIDDKALAVYCETHVQYIKARDALEQFNDNYVYVTHTGSLKVRPEWEMMMACMDKMVKMLVEFGCTPASRTRVKTVPGKPVGNKFSSIKGGKTD